MAGCYGFLIRAIHLSARARFHWSFLWPCSCRTSLLHTLNFARNLHAHSLLRVIMNIHICPLETSQPLLVHYASPWINYTTANHSVITAHIDQTNHNGKHPPRELILQECKTVTEIRAHQCRSWRRWVWSQLFTHINTWWSSSVSWSQCKCCRECTIRWTQAVMLSWMLLLSEGAPQRTDPAIVLHQTSCCCSFWTWADNHTNKQT